MRNFVTTAVIAVVFLVIAFSLMPRRIAHHRNQQAIKAEQEAMYGPGGIPPEPGPETPSISDATDSQTLLDIVRNAPPPDNQGSLGNYRARKALSILTKRKDSEAFEIMLENVRNCPDAPMCIPAIETLSHVWRDERAIEPLAAAASKGYINAVKTLGSCYLPQSRDALIPLMRHEDPEIRADAARYLRGLHKDPVVMSAVESAMYAGTLEVADAFWEFCLVPRYRDLIMSAFERDPMSESFSALRSRTIYIHHDTIHHESANSSVTMKWEGEETVSVLGPSNGVLTPTGLEILRKRLERLLDDPEHYNFTP